MGCTGSKPGSSIRTIQIPGGDQPSNGQRTKSGISTHKSMDFREDSLHSNGTDHSAIARGKLFSWQMPVDCAELAIPRLVWVARQFHRKLTNFTLKTKLLAKSWVKDDDLGFKGHLARVNDLCELKNKFEMGEILGEGITGQVRLCRSKQDHQVFAMKSLNVSRMDEAQIAELKAEIETLKRLDHPNIINLMEVFESEDNICIIMEHCSGGDLSQRRFETENDVCSVVFQLAEAVAHCHHMGIVHRDLKMENIMFVSKDSDSIRLIDFGLSKKFLSKDEILKHDKLLAQNDKNRVMKTACGTAFYMAPEMLTMSYSEKADVWALGVITYMLITGRPPFEGKDENTVFERVRRGRVIYNEKVWCRLSPEALQFTKALLTFDPEQRPSAKDALELPWLANYQKRRKTLMESKDGKMLGKEVCDSLMRFASYPPLKRAALMVVSHHVKEQDTRELRNMFLTLDEDHSGELTFEEMFNMIKKYSGAPVSEDYFHNVFNEMDQERTGKVHYMEFLAATLESRVKISGQLLNQAFDHLDVESSGVISIENMQALLGRNFSREDVEQLIKQGCHHCNIWDKHDAFVSRADFIQMMGDAQLPSPSATPTVPDTPTDITPTDTPNSMSRSETPSTLTSSDSPGIVEHHIVPPVNATVVVARAPPVMMPPKPFSAMRAPLLPSLTEEADSFDSRPGSPLELMRKRSSMEEQPIITTPAIMVPPTASAVAQ